MATIKFFIQSKNNPAGIYVRLKEGRTIDAKAKTKFVIDPKDWSDKKGQPKNLTDEDFKKLNEDLKKFSKRLLSHYNSVADTTPVNTQWLKDFITPPEKVTDIPAKVLEYFDYYALHKKSEIGAGTIKKNNVFKERFKRFQKAMNKAYFIKEIDAEFKLKFEGYCLSQNYAPNTIANTLKFIKTLCYHARNNGIETHFQLNSLVIKQQKGAKIFLTPEDILKIESGNYEHEYLINAKDWLIISCETGQRISDFMRFKKEFIRYEGKVPLIEFSQVKTGKKMAIPLSKKVMAILKKRGGEFPRPISDQRYNEYIKEVCRIAKVNELVNGSKPKTEDKITRKETGLFPKYELVTSHIGRRTFSTNNYGRIPTSLLINVTGHSTESMFLEYIGKTQTEKAIQLAEYF